jgi:hypothetical protein
MRSLWTITYVGSHTATTLKKLQRLLDFKAENWERERYVWKEEKIERVVFFVEHNSLDWNTLIVQLLQKTSKMAVRWEVSGDILTVVTVIVSTNNTSTLLQQKLPSGLREITWTVRLNQVYDNPLLDKISNLPNW